jgi:hypothetical protein
MATGRALTTKSEYKYLAEQAGKQRKYEAKSRIGSRINGPLVDDIEHFAEHAPELLTDLRSVVCENGGRPPSLDPDDQLRELSQTLAMPITVGDVVYEDGDRHPVGDQTEVADDE